MLELRSQLRTVRLLGSGFFNGFFGQITLTQQAADTRIGGPRIRPLVTALFDIQPLERLLQQLFVKRGHRERPDADLKSMRRSLALKRVMLHVPEVAELMLGAGG